MTSRDEAFFADGWRAVMTGCHDDGPPWRVVCRGLNQFIAFAVLGWSHNSTSGQIPRSYSTALINFRKWRVLEYSISYWNEYSRAPNYTIAAAPPAADRVKLNSFLNSGKRLSFCQEELLSVTELFSETDDKPCAATILTRTTETLW